MASIPIALFFFNIGVELGQFFFIAGVFGVMALGRKALHAIDLVSPVWTRAVPPYLIGSLAAFWTIQRLADF